VGRRYPHSSTVWKKTSDTIQTAGVPPKCGRSIFATIGWTAKTSAAARKIAVR
jgi:hypothetical protein